MAVGKSHRTPYKHFLLNAMAGKIVGVVSTGNYRVPAKADPFIQFIDLCGGDGKGDEFPRERDLPGGLRQQAASPKVLCKHAVFARSRGMASRVDIIEKDQNTYSELVNNMQGVCDLYFTHHMDARNYVLEVDNDSQAVFVHCDPNNVDQTPLTGPFVDSFNSVTTYLVTLGCNVSGIKMLPYGGKRSRWFDYVKLLTDSLPGRHDAVLFWLKRDASQWAYLATVPKVWSADFQRGCVVAGNRWWPNGVGSIGIRDSREMFERKITELFLTKAEFKSLDGVK